MLSIDLKDAYFHVLICPDQWKFLRFCVGMRTFEFKVLPFGITSAPQVFTKVIAPVTEHIRRTMGFFNCASLAGSDCHWYLSTNQKQDFHKPYLRTAEEDRLAGGLI